MLLSKSCEYAIRTALHIASRDLSAYTPVREVSAALGIPYPFLAKIVQTLTQAKILQTMRGPTGGIMLARAPSAITLEEIVVSIDGPGLFHTCVLGLPGCGNLAPCPLHEGWVPTRERIHTLFRTATLGEFAARVNAHEYRLSLTAEDA